MELAWNNWLKLQDDMVREQALRQLIHYATKVEDFKFLLKQESELKSIIRYWRTWEDEMELIYAYLYLRFGKLKRSKQLLKSSHNHSLEKVEEQTSLIVKEEGLYLTTVIELLSSEYGKAFLHLKQLLEELFCFRTPVGLLFLVRSFVV